MEIVALTKDKYKEWDNFCLNSDDAWFFHTTKWLEFILNYKPELKTENLGFMLYRQGEPIAVAPLTLETNKSCNQKTFEFSFGGGKIPSPALANDLTKKERESAHMLIFDHIDKLALEKNVKRANFREDPLCLSSLRGFHFNNLMKFGYIDVSLNTQLIDFGKTEQELWKDLRRNHHRNIKEAGDKKFKIFIYTSENITKDIFDLYKEMHHKASGRKTRSDKTFELMFEWVKNNFAFLVFVEFEGLKIGSEHYILYKNNVYGASAANDPNYEFMPIRHFLEWEAILWMKKKGISFYEIGLQQYGVLPYDFPDSKQLNISHFKKGFGGFTVPLFMGEKYYNEEYFLEICKSRINKFANRFYEKFDR